MTTISLLGRNIEKFQERVVGEEFSDITPKIQSIKEKKNALHYN